MYPLLRVISQAQPPRCWHYLVLLLPFANCLARFVVNLSAFAGIVHWKPPPQAMDAVVTSAGDHSLNQYGSGAGLPALVKALKHKLATQNGLEKVRNICMFCTMEAGLLGGTIQHNYTCHPACAFCQKACQLCTSVSWEASLTLKPLFCMLLLIVTSLWS